jgi:hypothetical protein
MPELQLEQAPMKPISSFTVILSSIIFSMFLTGCFSYTKEDTRTPTRGVEVPSANDQTAAIENEDGHPQRQRMLIYLDPWILGSR